LLQIFSAFSITFFSESEATISGEDLTQVHENISNSEHTKKSNIMEMTNKLIDSVKRSQNVSSGFENTKNMPWGSGIGQNVGGGYTIEFEA